jgi:hypothetical protein
MFVISGFLPENTSILELVSSLVNQGGKTKHLSTLAESTTRFQYFWSRFQSNQTLQN